MGRGSEMIKTTTIYFIGNFASKLLAFFLLPFYTAYLTSEDFGQVDLFMSTLPLIAPIFTLQATESVFRFLCTEKAIEERNRIITNSTLIFLYGILAFIVLYIPFVIIFHLSYAVLFFAYFVVTYTTIFLQQVLRGLRRTVEYATAGVVESVVYATLNIVLIAKYHMGGESLLLSATVSSLVIAMVIAIRIKVWRLINIKLLSKNEIVRQLKYGVPLIPNQISWWVINLSGKYILIFFSSTSQIGILAVASKFPTLLTIVNSIFFLAWTENLIQESNSEDLSEYFSKAFKIFMLFSFSVVACLLPVIKIYNVMTISGDFSEAWKYVPALFIATLFNGFATFLGSVYTASMKTVSAFTTTVVAAVANLILSLLLIPFLFIWGVALANILSYIVFLVVRLISVNNIITVRFKPIQISPSLILFLMSIAVYYYLNTTAQIVFCAIAAGISLWINREFVITILKSAGIICAKS